MTQNTTTTPDDELTSRFKSFHLTEDEQSEITLLDDDILASEAECRTSLFGKVVSQKSVNLGGLRTTMGLIWGNPTNFKVLEIGKGIYQFILPSESDVIRILNGKPWFFNNHFLTLEKWNPNLQPKQYCFQFTPLWVQIWGLPIQFISKEVGAKIGGRIGFVDDVAIPATGSTEGRYVRVRVHLDVTLPLKRGCMVKLASCPAFWVEFRYEKLPMFCRYCGMVGHDLHSCIPRSFDIDDNTLRDAQYGPWIRASPATQSGRRRPSSPPTKQSDPTESNKGRDGFFAPDEVNPNHPAIIPISNSIIKAGGAGSSNSKMDDLAHAEMLSKSRTQLRSPDFTPITDIPLNGFTPLQGQALQIWRSKNPIQPKNSSVDSKEHKPDQGLFPPLSDLAHVSNPKTIQPNPNIPISTSAQQGPITIDTNSPPPFTLTTQSTGPTSNRVIPKAFQPNDPNLAHLSSKISQTLNAKSNTSVPPSTHPNSPPILPPFSISNGSNPPSPTSALHITQEFPTDLELVDTPIHLAAAKPPKSIKQAAKGKSGASTYRRRGSISERGTTTTTSIRGKSTLSPPNYGKRKFVNLEGASDNDIVDPVSGEQMFTKRCKTIDKFVDGEVIPTLDTVEATSHKWSPMDQ
ncbi:hypothetical protein Vadar_006500 [Vaccinium darrowii]|uniref:Uncharacterized protein n=1 Tax=Vaccinium darrowii TaxID=229202 RepID=A0ACB7XGX5_9ERIC|nr:hypothetical protein Vadar_006500 [Vaccinium darrowii]